MSLTPAITVNQNIENHPIGENETVVPVFIYLSQSSTIDETFSFSTALAPLQFITSSDPEIFKRLRVDNLASLGLNLYFDNGGGPCFVYNIALPKELDDFSLLKFDLLLAPIYEKIDITVLAVLNSEVLISPAENPTPEVTAKNYKDFWEGILKSTAQHKKNLFCLIDAPRDEKACQQFVNLAQSINSSFAAAYWPYLVSNYTSSVAPSNNVTATPPLLPPSPAVAAVMYKTDRDAGVWKAPANVALTHIIRPETDMAHRPSIDKKDADIPANPALTSRINLIITHPGMGTRVWGCRTFQNDASKGMMYIQQRRLMTYIEHNMSELASFMMFEPNNELTWYKYKGVANQWLRDLWHSGGLFGDKEEEAWQLDLGLNETMTRQDINDGKIIVSIKVKILNPIEFIDIKLTLSINQPSSHANPGFINPQASLI